MMNSPENKKACALVLLVALGGGASAFTVLSLAEKECRERAAAMEKMMRNLIVDDGSEFPSDARSALAVTRRSDAFGLSPAMRGSLAEKGFSIVMEKTGADGTDIQARASDSAALIAFCSDLLEGRLEYEIGSMKFSVDEKAATSLEISSHGK